MSHVNYAIAQKKLNRIRTVWGWQQVFGRDYWGWTWGGSSSRDHVLCSQGWYSSSSWSSSVLETILLTHAGITLQVVRCLGFQNWFLFVRISSVWEVARVSTYLMRPAAWSWSATTLAVVRAGSCTRIALMLGNTWSSISWTRRGRRKWGTGQRDRSCRTCGSHRDTILWLKLAPASVVLDNWERISTGLHHNHPAAQVWENAGLFQWLWFNLC